MAVPDGASLGWGAGTLAGHRRFEDRIEALGLLSEDPHIRGLISGSDTVDPAYGDRLEALLPDVRRLDIAGATHNMFDSHPAEFNAGVLEFIGRPDG